MRGDLLLLLSALALPLSASPNDTMLTLAAGGLIPLKSAQIVMESEELEISIRRVTVTYRFRNETNSDIDAVVGFPLPPLNGGDLYNVPNHLPSKDPVNFVDFQVTVNGAAVKADVESRAFLDGRDITARAQAAGLSASVVMATKALTGLTPARRAALAKQELIECDSAGCFPVWESRIQYYWKQRFPAGATVVVQHVYRPVVGGSFIAGSMDGKSNVEPFCGGREGLAEIAQFKKRHPVKSDDKQFLWENHISYILTTANNWSGPIRNFRLTVVTESSEDLLFTCMAGLQRIAPTRYQMEQANFRPEKELDLLILTGKSSIW
jgi:hypothetical protein